MTLPDHIFFDLMRSIFGNIKTPFNKQRIMEDLSALFSREEIRKTITAYIDEGDHRIIAAVALLDEPAPAELECFFAGEFGAAEIRVMLLNLEERFLLYRFREEGVYRLALNPILERVLAPFAADKRVLFPSVSEQADREAGKVFREHPALDDRALAALFAFIPEERDFFKIEGGIRKKVFDAGRLLFPGLPLEPLVGAFQKMGLFRQNREGLSPNMGRLRAFGKLKRRERLEYCAAGIYAYQNEPDFSGGGIPGYFQWSCLRNLAFFIHRLLDILEPQRCYPELTLRRFVFLVDREERLLHPETTGGNAVPRYHTAKLLEAMELAGLLKGASPGLWQTGAALPALFPGCTGPGPERPVLAMDTAFSFFLYPEIAFADALTLAVFCSVRETGAVVRFELTRQSVIRGFNQGLSAAAMTELLNRLSGNRLDQNIGWTLKDWEARHASVSLYQGVVLTLAEDRRYLAEAEPLASLISRTLAPGVYLLSVQDKLPAAEALEKAGVDMIAHLDEAEGLGDEERSGLGSRAFPDPETAFRFKRPEIYRPDEEAAPASAGVPPALQESAGDYKKRFLELLKKRDLPKAEQEELAARIERRLVLNESQLAGASIRYEKLEARGLDYVGKAAIAKQAIASKSLLEVLWPHPEGGTNKALGVPEALEKKGGESVLILKPLVSGEPVPEESGRTDAIRLPLGKISLLRRIKQSIFGE
jgi:hypothetical protein